MPTQRDYMIATVLGEDNLGSREGQAAIIDSIFNRQAAILSGRRSPGYYEAKSSSIQDIVTANKGNQYNTWKGTPEEAGNAARAARALQGREATSGREREQYDQIAKIYDEYMAGEGGWQGISQGATFYQTPKSAQDGSFQNKFYRLGGSNDNYQDIGSHRFSGEEGQYFKDKAAFYAANPQMYDPNSSAGFDPSSPLNPGISTQGPGDFLGIGNGVIGDSGRPVETGNPYGFSGADVSGNVGPGSNNLGGATPVRPIDPYGNNHQGDPYSLDPNGPGGFGAGLNVSAGVGNGTFDAAAYLRANPDVAAAGMDPNIHYQLFGRAEGRPLGTTSFSNVNVSSDVGSMGLNPALAAFQPAPASTAFSNANVSSGIGNGSFDAAAYLRANPDVAASGMDPNIHYQIFGRKEGRPLGTTSFSDANVSSGVGNGSLASQITPYQPAPTVTSFSNANVSSGVANGGFNAAAYLQANPDVAASGMDPNIHYQIFGRREGRPLTPTGFSGANVSSNVGNGALNPALAGPSLQPAPTIPASATTPTIPAGSPEQQVAAVYQQVLGRNGGPDEVAYWAQLLRTGRNDLNSIVAQFQASPEAQTRGPQGLSLTVPAQTAPTIQAPAASQGLSIMASPTIGAPAASPVLSPGSTAQIVNDIYQAELGRPAEQGAIDYGNALLSSGKVTAADFAAQVRNSPEAQARRNAFPSQNAPTIAAPPTSPTVENFGMGQIIGAPEATPTISPTFAPTIAAPAAINAFQGISPTGFSNANVSGYLGATPQSFGSYYDINTGTTRNLGLDLPAANTNPISDYGFSGANVGGFDVSAFNGQPSPAPSSNFNAQASQNAYLDSQTNYQNAQNAALDAYNASLTPAGQAPLRAGMFTASTGNPEINKAVADYNVQTTNLQAQALAQRSAAIPSPTINVPQVAQGAFSPAPFFGRW